MVFNQQPQYPNIQMQQRIDNNNNIIWVDGEIGARGYPLYGINNQVILLDRSGDNYTCYIKVSDSTGRTSTRKFKMIEEFDEPAPQYNLSEYVKKDELQDLILSVLNQQKPKEEVVNDESISGTKPATIVKRTVL